MSVNFKSVVSKLIDTLMKKSVANASPGTVFSTVHITLSGQQVVSPCDGFVAGSIGTKNMNDAYFRIIVSNMSHTHESLTAGYYSTMHIPVKKGDSITCQYVGFSDTPYLNFVQRIGGGLNQVIQAIGGGLCLLSHSFNRFSSSLVAKQCRANQTLTSAVCQRLVRGAKFTPSLLTAISFCLGLISKQLKSPTSQNAFGLSQLQTFHLVFSCLSQKAIKSTFTVSTQEQVVCSLSSLRQSAQANLATGGAL